MPTITFMTCGTSLITNGVDQTLRSFINRNANTTDKVFAAINAGDAAMLSQHLDKRRKEVISADTATVRRMSAELNGFLAWQADNPTAKDDAQQQCYLIATDTELGQATATMIQDWLNHQGYQTQILTASGLNTANLESFRCALSELTRHLVDIIEGYKASGYYVNFNLTGGFKGINGFLQALATVFADQSYYLFEGSEALLYIPKLPYQLNADDIIKNNLTAMRRLANPNLDHLGVEVAEIPEIWRFGNGAEAMLSEWGELIWADAKPKLYQARVWDSPSPKIIITDEFIDSCKKADATTLRLINERLDDLAVYLESGSSKMLKSLDVKALQEKQYKDQNLHECDLDDHQRIFMIRNGNTMQLQKLMAALH